MDKLETPTKTAEAQVEAGPAHTPRPFRVTILALGVLIITVTNLVRLVLSIRDWDFLATRPGISPLYIALTGLVWTLAGVCLIWGLWSRKSWAPRLLRALVLTYALYYWLDKVFLESHALSGAGRAILLPVNWPFTAGITIVCLAFAEWIMSRRNVRAYFHQDRTEASLVATVGDSDE